MKVFAPHRNAASALNRQSYECEAAGDCRVRALWTSGSRTVTHF